LCRDAVRIKFNPRRGSFIIARAALVHFRIVRVDSLRAQGDTGGEEPRFPSPGLRFGFHFPDALISSAGEHLP
jgi:hypothetical protein